MINPLPAGPFGLIYADPPWRFKVYGVNGMGKAPDAHYETMALSDLMAMPVAQIAATNALLAMWVYDPMLPEALAVAESWGFTFTTVLFRWLKGGGQGRLFDDGEALPIGLGYHTRGGGCEECWLFKRGKGLPVLSHSIRKEFYSTRREHSRKPDEARERIMQYADGPYLELFARTSAPGWSVWGNEVGKYSEAAP